VGVHITREVATILQNRINDPRLQNVSITGTKLSDDLQVARIYYVLKQNYSDNSSISSNDSNLGKSIQTALDSARGFIRKELGQTLQLKRVPELVFLKDSSFEQGTRVDQLLHEIHQTEESK